MSSRIYRCPPIRRGSDPLATGNLPRPGDLMNDMEVAVDRAPANPAKETPHRVPQTGADAPC